MRHILKPMIMGVLLLFCISWAQSDSTETLNEPVVKTKTIIKKEIIIPKDPLLSGLLSAQLPGTGQIYCGKWLKGGIFLIGTSTLYGLANEYNQRASDSTLTDDEQQKNAGIAAGILIGAIVCHAWNIYDAYNTAKVHNIRMILEHSNAKEWKIGMAYEQKKISLGFQRRL